MVSAELKYRNHVPLNYIALECSNLEFYGQSDVVCVLDEIEQMLRCEKSDEHNLRMDKLRKHRQANYKEWLDWQKEIKVFKRKHVLWMLSKELREEMQILRAECDKLGANDEHLTLAIAQLDDNRFYEASEMTKKYKDLLAKLGFACKTATRNDSGLHEEVYESTCSDEELKVRVENMIAQLEKAKNEKQTALNDRYSQSDIITSREIFYN